MTMAKGKSTPKKENSKEIKKVTPKNKVKEQERYIEPRNYLYAILILVGSIILVLYIFEWYNVKKEEKLMYSYLISTKTIESSISDLNSLAQIRQEAPNSYFIYFGYRNDEDVYNLEKGLKRIIDKYKINDIFYYVDVTNLKNNNDDYLDLIQNNLKMDIDRLPAIIYVEEETIKDENVLTGGEHILEAKDFENFLKNNNFEIVK